MAGHSVSCVVCDTQLFITQSSAKYALHSLLATEGLIFKNMNYVYIIRSEATDRMYTGFTKDLKKRLRDHNNGKSYHTQKFKPWKIVAYFAFSDEQKARDFEKYLKTGSGIAFARKHLR